MYRYRAINRSGGKLDGEIEAQDREAVLARLHELDLLPVEVLEAGVRKIDKSKSSSLSFGRPSHAQITLFTHELAMLLKAGIPLAQALDLLSQDTSSKKLSKVIGDVRQQIDDGKSLHEAMSQQPDIFPQIYSNMVRVAEVSGSLEPVLSRIALNRQRAEKLKGKALSAALYPVFLIVMAIAAMLLMLTVVVPRFKQMIAQAGNEAPASAQFIIGASDWLLANYMYVLVFTLVGFALLVFLWLQDNIRKKIEGWLLHVPLIGHLLRVNLSIRFCRTLGTLMENGVELPTGLRLVRDVIGYKKAEQALEASFTNLRKGRSFLEPLEDSGLFPGTVINMLRVGEESSGLVQSLQHLADLYEDKLETDLQRTFTILEPVIILCVSGFIAGIIISVLNAVISINDLAI